MPYHWHCSLSALSAQSWWNDWFDAPSACSPPAGYEHSFLIWMVARYYSNDTHYAQCSHTQYHCEHKPELIYLTDVYAWTEAKSCINRNTHSETFQHSPLLLLFLSLFLHLLSIRSFSALRSWHFLLSAVDIDIWWMIYFHHKQQQQRQKQRQQQQQQQEPWKQTFFQLVKL